MMEFRRLRTIHGHHSTAQKKTLILCFFFPSILRISSMQSWLWSDIETVLVENWPVRGLASLEFGRRGEFDMET